MISFKRLLLAAAGAALLVGALQPAYFLAMATLDRVVSHERTWSHIRQAFDAGVLGRNQLIASGDRFTDCYSLGVGLEPGISAVAAGITASRPSSDRHACDDLRDAAANPAGVSWSRYARYWHGYRLYSAPLASAIPILALKLTNLALLAAVSMLFITQASRLIGSAATIALCAPVLFCSDFVRLWHVTPHTVSTVVILGGAALFVVALRRRANFELLIVLSAGLGSLFNFVDFLVNPPWMPMLLAFFTMAADGRRPRLAIALFCVGAWVAGYSATWFAKWVAAYLVEPAFDIKFDVLSTAVFRIAGENAKVIRFPLVATARMLASCVASWGLPLLLIFAVIAVRAMRGRPLDRLIFVSLAWPVLIPVVWFEILSSHSQIHAFFVSRTAAAAVGVLIAAMFAARHVKVADLRLQAEKALKPGRSAPQRVEGATAAAAELRAAETRRAKA